MKRRPCHSQKTASFVMDSLHDLRSKVNHGVVIVSLIAEPNASYRLHQICLFQQSHQLSDYVVNSGTNLAQTNNVRPDIARLEVLSSSRASTHELFLSLDGLSCTEDTVLNDKLSRPDQCLRHQKGLPMLAFSLMCNKRTRVGLRIMDLKVDDKVVHLYKGTYDSSHHLEFLQENVVSNIVKLQRSPQVFRFQLRIIHYFHVRINAGNKFFRCIRPSWLPMMLTTFRMGYPLDEIIKSKRDGCNCW